MVFALVDDCQHVAHLPCSTDTRTPNATILYIQFIPVIGSAIISPCRSALLDKIPLIITRVTQVIAGVMYYGMILSKLLSLIGYKLLEARGGRNHRSTSRRATRFFLKAVSEAVREGDLKDEEDEETESMSGHDPPRVQISSRSLALEDQT